MEEKQWAVYEDAYIKAGPFNDEGYAEQVMDELFREEWSVRHEYYVDEYPLKD